MPTLVTLASFGFFSQVPDFVSQKTIDLSPAVTFPFPPNQKWYIVSNLDGVPVPPGLVNIFADNPNPTPGVNPLCWDVPGGFAFPGLPVQLFPVHKPGGTPNQQWRFIPAGNNWVFIATALNPNLVLSVNGIFGGWPYPGATVTLSPITTAGPAKFWFPYPAF